MSLSVESINLHINMNIIDIDDYINKKSAFTELSDDDFEQLVPKLVAILEEFGFDYLLEKYNNISEDNAVEDWFKLKKWSTTKDTISAQTQRGLKIIKMIMTHFYEVKNFKGQSIKNLWNKKYITKALIVNRKTHSTPYFSEIVRQVGFTAGTSKITIYRPTLTKRIVEVFNAKNVLDVCVGWGGRMLGACAVDGVHYTGFEPFTKTYNGLVKMKNLLELENATLYNSRAEDKLTDLPDKSFDLALTSPPYYNLEIYSDEDTQSHHYGSYSNWVEEFLQPVVFGVLDKLKDDGTSCWSVKNFRTDERCNLYDDVVRLHEERGWFKIDREFRIGSSARPGAGSKSKAKSNEITHVFKKRIEDNETVINSLGESTVNSTEDSAVNNNEKAVNTMEESVMNSTEDNPVNNYNQLNDLSDFLKTETTKAGQIDRYENAKANPGIVRIIKMVNGKGTFMERFARHRFPKLKKRGSGKDSGHDHVCEGRKIEHKTAAAWDKNFKVYKWQHIEQEHDWEFLLLTAIYPQDIKWYIIDKDSVNDLIKKEVIKLQGKKGKSKEGYWVCYSDIKEHLTEIKNENDLLKYIT